MFENYEDYNGYGEYEEREDLSFLEDTYLGCNFKKISNDSYDEYIRSLEY